MGPAVPVLILLRGDDEQITVKRPGPRVILVQIFPRLPQTQQLTHASRLQVLGGGHLVRLERLRGETLVPRHLRVGDARGAGRYKGSNRPSHTTIQNLRASTRLNSSVFFYRSPPVKKHVLNPC